MAPSGTLNEVLEGFHYVLRRQRVILMLIGAASMYTFATSAFSTLFPVFPAKKKNCWTLGRSKSATCGRHSASGCCWFRWASCPCRPGRLPKRIQLMGMSSLVSGVALLGLIVTSNRLAAAALMVIIGMGAGTLTPVAWECCRKLRRPPPVGAGLGDLQSWRDDVGHCGHDDLRLGDAGVRRASERIRHRRRVISFRRVSMRVGRWVQTNWAEATVPAEGETPAVVMVTQPTSH